MARFKRREFIRDTALLGAGSLLGGQRALAAVGADYDVVIIGAGMAGMTAARLLSRAGPGLKVLILEARGRVGGRMFTAPDKKRELPRHGVELGAQFVHGSKAATWELIKEFGIETRPANSFGEPDYRYFSADGNKSSISVHSLPRLMTKMGSSYRDYRGPDMSYQAFVDRLGVSAGEAQLLASEAISWTAEPNRISLKSVVEHGKLWEDWQDQDFQIVGGYGRLAKKMAADLKGKIQLNSKVDEVFWRGGIAGISYKDRGSSAGLTTRRLIVTLPIGVLQSGQVLIEPALPDWKQRSIDSLEMGQAVVVPMRFTDPFWRDSLKGPGGWSTADERINFEVPHPPDQAGTAIIGWFAGSAAQELSDLGPEAGLARVLRWLQQASGIDDLASKLSWHLFQDWVRDPYSLGSYSFNRPGGIGQRSELAKPVDNTLYFAGEATAEPPHYQTVHGAYMSGKRVAQEVAISLNVGDSATIMEDTPVITEEKDEPLFNPL